MRQAIPLIDVPGTTRFQRMDNNLLRAVVSVPKAESDWHEWEWKRQRMNEDQNPNPPGGNRKA